MKYKIITNIPKLPYCIVRNLIETQMDIHDGLRILDRWFLPSRIMKKFAYKYILALICSHDIIADEIKCIIKCISSLSPNAIKSGARIMSDMPPSLSIRHFYTISFLILLNISRNRVKMFLLSSGFYHLSFVHLGD